MLEKIVSGGQTGADRAALDFAIARGIPHGGWCPKGRLAEDGTIDASYELTETPTKTFRQRTEWNVRDSDGTVIFSTHAQLSGGSKRTAKFARLHHKPVLHLSRDDELPFLAESLRRFIQENEIKVLNVAGPRASKEPDVAAFVTEVLEKAFESSGSTTAHGQPTLETARLILRPFTTYEAPAVARLAGRREIADTTLSIPPPYSKEQAKAWVSRIADYWSQGKAIVFAIVTKRDMQLVGAVGLRDIDREHSQTEMGFWIGVESWGHGYATEAANAALDFGFQTLGLNRIYAHHMLRNPASGRVLEKIGMKREGLLRERVRKWGIFEDVAILAILKKEWSDRQ